MMSQSKDEKQQTWLNKSAKNLNDWVQNHQGKAKDILDNFVKIEKDQKEKERIDLGKGFKIKGSSLLFHKRDIFLSIIGVEGDGHKQITVWKLYEFNIKTKQIGRELFETIFHQNIGTT